VYVKPSDYDFINKSQDFLCDITLTCFEPNGQIQDVHSPQISYQRFYSVVWYVSDNVRGLEL